jgi:anti-anti-sigma regulatory factor
MEVKIDTKEKMHVILLKEPVLAANMTEELENTCKFFLDQPVKNVIVNLANITKLDIEVTDSFLNLQQSFAEANVSLVFCCINASIMKKLEKLEVNEMLNITPTESEAWDIVQMEEIEREFL